jgi:polyhydroxyalkanoate synthase
LLGAPPATLPEPTVVPERGDRRFNANAWRDNPWYSLLKQTYLLNARLLDDMVEAAGVEEKEKHKLRFYVRQFIDSMSPANFAATNPEVMTAALESKGRKRQGRLCQPARRPEARPHLHHR